MRDPNILDLTPEGAVESATQEVQETRPADGPSSECPLDMEDGNRKTSTVEPLGPPRAHSDKLVCLDE